MLDKVLVEAAEIAPLQKAWDVYGFPIIMQYTQEERGLVTNQNHLGLSFLLCEFGAGHFFFGSTGIHPEWD